jgi:FkbM family methyltransferase
MVKKAIWDYTKKLIYKFINDQGFELARTDIGTSEKLHTKCLFDHHKIDLVLDVGANRGRYASFLRECGYLGKIVSFEPLSSVYDNLLKLSKKDPLWDVAPRVAIGNCNDEIIINIAGNDGQSSSALKMLDTHLKAAPDSAYSGSERVKLRRLDEIAQEYIEKNEKVFLKIDVQGLEEQVIQGAEGILPTIEGIQIELSLVPLYQNQILYRETIDLLDELGYEMHSVVPNFIDTKTGRVLQMDGIFFRR